MQTSISLALVLMLIIPSLAQAQEKNLLAAAEFAAAELAFAAAAELAQEQQQVDMGSTRRSMGRVALGLVIAGAGAAMLLIDPKQPAQPTQPGTVSRDVLVEEAATFISGQCGTIPFSCEFTEIALLIEPDLRVLESRGILAGGLAGAGVGLAVATLNGRTVYAGQFKPFIPFKERSPGMKYGGAVLAVTGALVAGLWSQVPVMNAIAVAPTLGGLRVGTSVGF